MGYLSVSSLKCTKTLIEHYQSLAHLPGFVLLESSDRKSGRYDILAAYPYEIFSMPRHGRDSKETFSCLQSLLPVVESNSDLPFQGGAIGYVSYDFGAELYGINASPHALLINTPLMEFGLYDWAIITDHHQQKTYLVAANQRAETASLIKEIEHCWYGQQTLVNSFTLVKEFKPLISRDAYQKAFCAIHEDLRKGRAYQVNYTQPFIAHFNGDPWEMYKRISRCNPVPFSAFLRLHQMDVLSFSPERFLLMDKESLLTSPIKGSARRSPDASEDTRLKKALAVCEKNKAENVMIVDLMRNDLGKISVPGTVNVNALCELQSYNSVHHLVSHIEAQCRQDVSTIEAFMSCFPGGSITGAPKKEAMRIIHEHEPFARGIYCGSIGYFSAHGRFDSNIAIRTVTAKEEQLYLAAGGGIVMDSTWEDEYEECYTKIKAIVSGI
ncbi:aminodeoxychorismate synthase component I [Legionella septentrionalis]|uniref:aminodeoxychorismate synthase component I n=1 Tax=Legionella septentrionalis TaxID=2498109 RepID=UPI000F8DCBD9|nr:aminodeoxychorismate synthase component I [Legionella septentrionalis]RUR09471.1 aminodeoxychorismate synthase component I [Legionella septentrionalis]